MTRIAFVLAIYLCLIVTAQQSDFLGIARDGTLSDVQTSIYAGADINSSDEYGQTGLMYAASNNEDPQVHAFIVNAGGDVNARSLAGWTALMYAVRDNTNPQVIEMLLDLGADPLLKNSEQLTALDYASNNLWLQDSTPLLQLQAVTVAAPPPTPVPAAPAPAAPVRSCCKMCRKGKACGNSCISRSYNCSKGAGCACNAEIGTDNSLIAAAEQFFSHDPVFPLTDSCEAPVLSMLVQ